MIRRFSITAVLGAAAAASLLTGVAGTAAASEQAVTPAAMVTSLQPADGPHDHGPGDGRHGPGWDGRHGGWDGRGGFGHGGGWDGNGGGWDGHHWWVSADRCNRGGGHVDWRHRPAICFRGRFNGAPVR